MIKNLIIFAVKMMIMIEPDRRYDLKVRCVDDYNRYIGTTTEHPW